jgi:hypothetical protein
MLVGAVLTLIACDVKKPLDCKVVENEIHTCFKQNRAEPSQDRVFQKCVPLAEPERFHGTWATDFEFNEFYAGEILPTERVWQFPKPSTSLVIGKSELRKYNSNHMAHVLEVKFIGRRPVCNVTEPYRQIIVDQVSDVKVIESRPTRP